MTYRALRFGGAAVGLFSLVACGGNRDAASRDSAAAAIADSQPGMNGLRDTGMMSSDPSLRRDTLSGMSMPTDGANRGTGTGRQRRP